MTYFSVIAIALLLLAILFVLIPLLRRTHGESAQISNANVIRQRIEELEEEVQQGVISAKDKESAIRELKLALVDETSHVELTEPSKSRTSSPLVLASLLALPAVIIGVIVYIQTNHLDELREYNEVLANIESLSQKVLSGSAAEVTPDDYAKYALIIRERLRETPEDTKGWMYLGQIQLAIGKIEQSIAAYERAVELSPEDDVARYRYVNSLVASGAEASLEQAQRQISFLISKQPANRQYRLLQTVIAAQRGDAQRAAENFIMIKDQLSVDSDFYRSLITQLQSIGVDPSLLGTSDSENLRQTSIQIEIDLIAELESKVPASGYLILFAQDAGGTSGVPLAVKRVEIPQFPARFNLSLSDAMLPSMNLDSAEQVTITARISADADVAVSPGELEGTAERIELATGQQTFLKLTINQEL